MAVLAGEAKGPAALVAAYLHGLAWEPPMTGDRAREQMTPTTPEAMAEWFANWPHVGEVPPDWNQHAAAHLRRLAAVERAAAHLAHEVANLREYIKDFHNPNRRGWAIPAYIHAHAADALRGMEHKDDCCSQSPDCICITTNDGTENT